MVWYRTLQVCLHLGRWGGERLLLVAISELALCIASVPTTVGRKGRQIQDEGYACKRVFVEPVL
jgi:hypothetical protein